VAKGRYAITEGFILGYWFKYHFN